MTMLQTQRHFLTPQPTPFIGRTRELTEIVELLVDPACRLLTLVGPGGIGKTRLALHVAHAFSAPLPATSSFAHGVLMVGLTPVNSPSGIVSAIAEAASFTFYSDVPPKQQLLDYVREKSLLLVLDNFEHLLEAVDLLSEILAAAPVVKLLVTSREVLNLQEEWLYPVEGLEMPASAQGGDVAGCSAVQLFVERARRVRPNFTLAAEQAAVVRICQLVDGMPLALELAATWLKVLPCAAIAAEIERNLAFLTTTLRNVPERHRSMRAVFDQSWQLLSDGERTVLKRLAVFRGSFSHDAAEQIAGASLRILSILVEKSLVRVTTSGRYHLHELLRQFAEEYLRAVPADDAATRERHSAYYLRLLQEHGHLLRGEQQQRALSALREERENVRTGWQWAVAQGQLDAIAQGVEAVYDFYQIQSRYQEGEDLFTAVVEQLQHTTTLKQHPDLELLLEKVAVYRGAFCYLLGKYAVASTQLQASLAAARARSDGGELAFVLNLLGRIAGWQGNKQLARQHLSESLAISRAIDDNNGVADALYQLAEIAVHAGNYAEGKRLGEESLAVSRQLGRPDWIAYALTTLGWATVCLGEYREAEAYYRESLALFDEIGDQLGVALALGGIGLVLWARGGEHVDAAMPYIEKSVELCREIGHRLHLSGHLCDLAQLANDLGEYARAQQYAHEGLALAQELGSRIYISFNLCSLGETACKLGDFAASRQYLLEALQMASEAQQLLTLTEALFQFAILLVQESARMDVQEPLKTQQQRQALELLTLVGHHPACMCMYKERAACLQAELEMELPAQVVATARARGQTRTLEATVAESMSGAFAAPSLPSGTGSATTESQPAQPVQPLLEPLTEREQEVLQLLAGGLSNQAIADKLILSLGTVKWYVHQIYGKLHVQTRTQAVARARELHLLSELT